MMIRTANDLKEFNARKKEPLEGSLDYFSELSCGCFWTILRMILNGICFFVDCFCWLH